VFRKEPLPGDDPLWRHPKITIMPHASRRVDIGPMLPRVAHAIRCLREGKPLESEIDRKLGY